MESDKIMLEQAELLEQQHPDNIKKVPLVKRDQQKWDSADQHAILANTEINKENQISNAELEMQAQEEALFAKMKKQPKKKPLIKKERTRWDSGNDHAIRPNHDREEN